MAGARPMDQRSPDFISGPQRPQPFCSSSQHMQPIASMLALAHSAHSAHYPETFKLPCLTSHQLMSRSSGKLPSSGALREPHQQCAFNVENNFILWGMSILPGPPRIKCRATGVWRIADLAVPESSVDSIALARGCRSPKGKKADGDFQTTWRDLAGSTTGSTNQVLNACCFTDRENASPCS
jgi:hypothetical protein